MSKRERIAWVDDNPTRAPTAAELGAQFINVQSEDLASTVAQLLNGPQRPLVILDHILDQTSSDNPVFKRGSTIAEALKEKWPACPVIGVTAANVGDITLRTKEVYDDLLSYTDFRNHIDRIKPIARDFARISKARLRKPADLVALLKPPIDDASRLEAALPDDLKRFLDDRSIASRTYRWVKQLTGRAGILYDALWTATYLGLNDSGLRKMSREFAGAEYKGVFRNPKTPRWWVSRLTETLFKKVQPDSGEMAWHAGRRLPGIRSNHYSRCYACDDRSPPEVVAYLDASSDERRPMHLTCTVLDPRYKRRLYFEDIRMMQGG